MKILHVLLGPRAEGTPRLVLDWLTVEGHQQELLFLSSAGELRHEFEKFDTWQLYNDAFPLKFINGFRITHLVKETCEQRRPDVVISWSMGFSHWIHLGARRASSSKLITHAGNAPGQTFIGRYIFTYLTCWIGSMVNAKVICCSDYIKNEYLKIPLLRSRDFFSVYNCFRKEKFEVPGLSRNPQQAIMVATLERHKDHATLLEAWRIIEREGYPYKLLLAGAGSLEAKLKRMKEELNLRNVQFMGTRSDVNVLLNQSLIFVFSTTIQEGFGTVLLEAMAAGCIIIASRVPACVEILRNGQYGILVTPGDTKEMASAIIRTFAEPRHSKNEQAKDYLDGFSPEAMVKSYMTIALTPPK